MRSELNDEVHARPSDALEIPARISYLVLHSEIGSRERACQHVMDLAKRMGGALPERTSNHHNANLGQFSICWERHSEFTRYAFCCRPASTARANARTKPCWNP